MSRGKVNGTCERCGNPLNLLQARRVEEDMKFVHADCVHDGEPSCGSSEVGLHVELFLTQVKMQKIVDERKAARPDTRSFVVVVVYNVLLVALGWAGRSGTPALVFMTILASAAVAVLTLGWWWGRREPGE